MPTDSILILGAGGHAKVVLDALLRQGLRREGVEVADDGVALQGREFLGAPVRALAACLARRFHVAIGAAVARERAFGRLRGQGRVALSVLHTAASISPLAVLGEGVFVAAQAVVGPAAQLGEGVIVNHGAVVDHDCVVGAFSHIAPNATLGGGVTIGRRVLVGAGATLLPGVRVGDDTIIGAGALVARSIDGGGTWIGVPAVRMKDKEA
jgi:sugar O-acyltransferase (sialic acid O-acetyltransferase NeuD family)